MGKPEDIPAPLSVAEVERIARKVAGDVFRELFALRPLLPGSYAVDGCIVVFLPTRTIIATCIEPTFARLIVRALNAVTATTPDLNALERTPR